MVKLRIFLLLGTFGDKIQLLYKCLLTQLKENIVHGWTDQIGQIEIID